MCKKSKKKHVKSAKNVHSESESECEFSKPDLPSLQRLSSIQVQVEARLHELENIHQRTGSYFGDKIKSKCEGPVDVLAKKIRLQGPMRQFFFFWGGGGG